MYWQRRFQDWVPCSDSVHPHSRLGTARNLLHGCNTVLLFWFYLVALSEWLLIYQLWHFFNWHIITLYWFYNHWLQNMKGCHTDTRKPEKVQAMASVKNSLLTYFSGSLGNCRGLRCTAAERINFYYNAHWFVVKSFFRFFPQQSPGDSFKLLSLWE